MKSILLVLMLATMLFSSEKQIIVGSYLQEQNALNALVRLNSQTLSDNKLSNLININSTEIEIKSIGEYQVIALSPFTDYVQLLRTLRALEPYYADAYVLDQGQKLNMVQVETKVATEKIIEKVVEKIVPLMKEKIQEPKKVEKVKTYIEPINSEKYADEYEEDFSMEIILAVFALLVLLLIIYKIATRKKKDLEFED